MSYKWYPVDETHLFKTRPGEEIVDLDKYIETLRLNGYEVKEEDIPPELRKKMDSK